MTDRVTSPDGTERSRRLSAFPYPGGKTPYVSDILECMPGHRRYVEPFGGSASVLLNKPESYIEVFNDLDDDVVHFFKAVREHRDDLLNWLRNVPYSETQYEQWQAEFLTGDRPDDDVKRAGMWFYLRYANYGGSTERRAGFKRPGKRNEARSFRGGIDALEHVVDRLQEVTILNERAVGVLERYDNDETLFYCDPPYYDPEYLYYPAAEDFDHGVFVNALGDTEARWIVSYDELPPGLGEIAETVVPIDVHYSLPNTEDHDRKESQEVLAMNYDPSETGQFVDESTEQATLVTDGGRYPHTDTEQEDSP